MPREKKIIGIRPKFATIFDQIIHISLNGFQLKISADKVDDLFEDPDIRYCVNSVLFVLDRNRQDSIDFHQQFFPSRFNNTATILNQRVDIDIWIEDPNGKLPERCAPKTRGTAWDIHENPKSPYHTREINYLTGTIDFKEEKKETLN